MKKPKLEKVRLRLKIVTEFTTSVPKSVIDRLTSALANGEEPLVEGELRDKLVRNLDWARAFENKDCTVFTVQCANKVNEDGSLDMTHELSPLHP